MSDVEYLLTLEAVRERAGIVLEIAQQGDLTHFDYHAERMSIVADFVTNIIERDFGPDKFDTIPPHGRWQHFNVGNIDRISKLLKEWEVQGCEKIELCRRLMDLFVVSVLLDAGAGDHWGFTEPGTENVYERSEGIAVASLYMVRAGLFDEAGQADRVDGKGLSNLAHSDFQLYFQISDSNPMIGTAERVKLLNTVGTSLLSLPDIFGEDGRPGNLVDYLLGAKSEVGSLDFKLLWTTLQRLLIPSWPKNRTHIDGKPLGDAWPLKVLGQRAAGDSRGSIQPFHKLTQWLAYSLSVPFARILGLQWTNMDLGTGLPEYRNGGLFVDLGVLSLKPEALELGKSNTGAEQPGFPADSDVIVEWRAMTVALLDDLHGLIKARFLERGVNLSMAQMLEAGTWKGGRELAAKHRPSTRMSPIVVMGDGTLF